MLLKSYFKHFLFFEDLRIAQMRAYAYRIIYFCTIVDISDNQGKSPTQTKNRPPPSMGVCHETSLHVLDHTYMFFNVCLFVCVDT